MALLLAAPMARAQPADAPLLTVALADGRSQSFARAALEALPQEKAGAKLRDGAPLPERLGPPQLISTGESRPGRRVRQLRSLEVKSLP